MSELSRTYAASAKPLFKPGKEVKEKKQKFFMMVLWNKIEEYNGGSATKMKVWFSESKKRLKKKADKVAKEKLQWYADNQSTQFSHKYFKIEKLKPVI